MIDRGLLMLSLLALSGISSSGCYQPAPMPPFGARMPPPAALGGGYRYYPTQAQGEYPFANTVTPSDDLWMPDVEPRDWKHIVIHHTATSRGSVESIHDTHVNRKDKSGKPWLGIGYHFVIGNGNGMGDGEIESTFRWREQLHGAHAGSREYNQHGIGIALIGNFEEQPPTRAQLAAVKQLVGTMKSRYGISGGNVVGHRDLKATACPGKYFPMDEVSRAYPAWRFSRLAQGRLPEQVAAEVRSRQ